MSRKPNSTSSGGPFTQETIDAVWKKAKEYSEQLMEAVLKEAFEEE